MFHARTRRESLQLALSTAKARENFSAYLPKVADIPISQPYQWHCVQGVGTGSAIAKNKSYNTTTTQIASGLACLEGNHSEGWSLACNLLLLLKCNNVVYRNRGYIIKIPTLYHSHRLEWTHRSMLFGFCRHSTQRWSKGSSLQGPACERGPTCPGHFPITTAMMFISSSLTQSHHRNPLVGDRPKLGEMIVEARSMCCRSHRMFFIHASLLTGSF